ncbi:MAG: hypothetical protein H3C63_09575 [Candidatus Omnitrophica bacterium]|nr:hypothetical protein [Candidatus Omnitrophota bacterium]MCK6494883.1 hypothetical protein [bacterium]NUP92998.1 hypothetical protein [Candidatus Omnitrophota bacterium]
MAPFNSTQELARKQVALLGKMLLYSVDHLTQEDHEVYDELVEELAARADSKREISAKVAQETRPGGSEKPDHSQAPQNRKLQGLKPEMVVRLFIECWDKQDFKQEFFCLSDQFRQGNRSRQQLEEYVNSRYEKYSQRFMTGPISKQIVDISAPVVDVDMGTVQVAERHTGKSEDMILYRTYSMVFENTAWRIIDFKTNQKRIRKRA